MNIMKNKTLKHSLYALLALGAMGCGGGSGSSSDTSSNEKVYEETERYYAHCIGGESRDTLTIRCAPESDCAEGETMIGDSYAEDNATCERDALALIAKFTKEDLPSTQEQAEGLAYLNGVRSKMGLLPFRYNTVLEETTAKHENYIGDVYEKGYALISHWENNETAPSPYYGGVSFLDRAISGGYYNIEEMPFWPRVGEVISYSGANEAEGTTLGPKSVMGSIRSLMTAIYHREVMIDSWMDEIGIGGVQRNFTHQAQPHLMAAHWSEAEYDLAKRLSPDMVVYPFEGQEGVWTAFYRERPNPLPGYLVDITGNPVSVHFNTHRFTQEDIEVVAFDLYEEESNSTVELITSMNQHNDPNGIFTAHDYALFPLEPLETDAYYRVELRYILKGEEKQKQWVFKTQEEMNIY